MGPVWPRPETLAKRETGEHVNQVVKMDDVAMSVCRYVGWLVRKALVRGVYCTVQYTA